MMNEAERSNLGTLTLEKLKIRARAHISNTVLEDMKIEMLSDFLADSFVANLRAFVWSNQITHEIRETAIPATWWDAFKEAYFPNWLEQRFPIRTTTITTETKYVHICPHLTIQARDEERFHLQFLTPPDQRYKV